MKTSNRNSVLVIGDDAASTNNLSVRLRQLGYRVDASDNTFNRQSITSKVPFESIILDVNQSDCWGDDMCRDLRITGICVPILMISEQCEKSDIVRALEFGADDYLTKPYSYKELVARLRALVRRHRKTFAAIKTQRYDLELDVTNSTVRSQTGIMKLTRKEALLLQRLMIDAPDAISRQILLEDVWGIDDMHTSNRLDVYIRRLRWKLEQLTNKDLIHTIRSQGYYFGPKN